MWDTFETTKRRPETAFFGDWIKTIQASETMRRRVRDAIFQAEAAAPEVSALRTTPQSAPHHCEGLMVSDHLERMLAGLFAIVDGTSLLQIEEFAREQAWHPVLQELEETIREQAATLEAYIFIHDLAKATTVSFTSPEGSMGASEGFVKNSRLDGSTLVARYGKFVRAFEMSQEDSDPSEIAARFYDAYQIRVHYDNHATDVLKDRFSTPRNALCDLYRLTDRDRELLSLVVRSHIDVIQFFANGSDPAKVSLLLKRANKVGLDGDDVLDLQLAALFLDSVVGSLRYDGTRSWCGLESLFGFIRSEQQGIPLRHAQRQRRIQEREARDVKHAMQKAGIDAMSIIELLALPVGPERSRIIGDVAVLVTQSDLPIPLNAYPTQVVQGIAQARALYQARKSW